MPSQLASCFIFKKSSCSLSWSGKGYVDQAGLNLTDPTVSSVCYHTQFKVIFQITEKLETIEYKSLDNKPITKERKKQ